jgi:hypothetical protein
VPQLISANSNVNDGLDLAGPAAHADSRCLHWEKALQPLTKGTDAEAVVTELASWAKQAKTTGLVWFTY